MKRPFLIIIIAGTLVACSSTPKTSAPRQDGPPSEPIHPSKIVEPVPKPENYSKYGNPDSYTVLGKKYEVLNTHLGYEQTGTASWYGTKFHGQLTSSREPYDMYAMTAAHKSLPIPSYAKVTNLDTGKSIIVRINDRGPFAHDRIIDLSYAAATKLGILAKGTGRVKVESIDTNKFQPPEPVFKDKSKIYLQVASFDQRENAEKLAKQLKHKGKKEVEISPHASRYRVLIGPFAHENEAKAFQETLAGMNLEKGFVVRL